MGLFSLVHAAAPKAPEPATPPRSLSALVVSDLGLTARVPEVGEQDLIESFRGAPVGWSKDLDRIVALPRRALNPQDPAAAKKWTALLRRDNPSCDCVARWGYCITELLPIQGWALEEAHAVGGLLAPIGVGHGKTGVDVLIPLAMGVQRALLLIPAPVKAQLLTRDFPQWSAHFKTPNLAGYGKQFVSGRPVLHVVTYNELSLAKNSDLLPRLAPDLVVADEAHKLKDPKAARTKRFLRAFREQKSTRFVGLSGTLTTSGLKDFAHLSALALGDGSPLPLHHPTLEDWSAALDAVDIPKPTGMLNRLCVPGETARQGFSRRLIETRGVVSTKEGSLGCSLIIQARRPSPKVPEEVAKKIQEVRDSWNRPDGDVLKEAIQVAAVCRQLSAGFYYRWIFPRGEDALTIKRWFAARSAWNTEVRERLKISRAHLDSELLVTKAAIRWHNGFVHIDDEGNRREFAPGCKTPPKNAPTWASDAWCEWRDVRHSVKPETEAVWVSDFLVEDAAQWARQHVGIVWCEHSAFGEAVAAKLGLPYYDGGKKNPESQENGSRSAVLAIKPNLEGKNLQRHWSRNLVANPPSSGAAWEQMLGRTHRQGQPADEVIAEVYRHTPEYCEALDKADTKAEYIEGTLRAEQKLTNATKDLDI